MAIPRLIFLLTVFCLCGCAGTRGYLADRGRDAADIVTCTVGKGFGVGVRAGPVHGGLLYQGDFAGLAGGEIFVTWRTARGVWVEPLLFIPTHQGIFGGVALLRPEPDLRHKGYTVTSGAPPPFVWFTMVPGLWRRPWIEATGRYPWHFLTDINIALGLGVSVRLGLNPGELADFLLGWTTVDFFGDDGTGHHSGVNPKERRPFR